MEEEVGLIPDLPSGPLDIYRKQASVDWKKLKLVFEQPDVLRLKMKVWKVLEADPLFQNHQTALTTDEQKRRAMLQLLKYHQYKFYTDGVANNNYKKKTRTIMILNEAVAALNLNVSVKFALGVSLFTNAILCLGTERHLGFYEAAWKGEILSCIALTEVSHGSNTKRIRTTATYDPATKEFVIHTPDFEAAKCWIGNMGKTCTYSLLFAQLYAEGACHGIHGFVVPIRDPKTLQPYPGIILGDMGEKNGLNGIDNGFIMFQNYRIPRENLLNRISDVTPEGIYETTFTTPEQQLSSYSGSEGRFSEFEEKVTHTFCGDGQEGNWKSAALQTLSAARVAIMAEATNACCAAITIAIRYAAVRRQFGPTDEFPIIEYQLHQWRLFPYLSATCALKTFVNDFTDEYLETVEKSNSGESVEDLPARVSEIHAMVSASKPLITWICRDTIQECREACGGHGYLKASGLGDLRNNFDAAVTYEGDNNVLMQQTSNWLLRQWERVVNNEEPLTPFGSIKFLSSYAHILQQRFTGKTIEDVLSHSFISSSYQWLICCLLDETTKRLSLCQQAGEDKFTARNNAQVFRARTLSLIFAENNALEYFWQRCEHQSTESIKLVLQKLYFMYGLSCVEKHLADFYQGCFASGTELASLVKDGILHMCSQLKPEAVAIVDALAPPDFVLNSVIGKANGKVYDNLQAEFFHNAGALERPSWWRDILPRPVSKL